MYQDQDDVKTVQDMMDEWLNDDSKVILEPDQFYKTQYRVPPRWPEIVDPLFIDNFLKYLDSIKWDHEAAHIYEDELHAGVLAAIAEDRCCDPDVCAKKALKSHYIPFKRGFLVRSMSCQ